MSQTVVLGAGLAGLSAAYHGSRAWRVLEASGRPGGECVTDEVAGFSFDRAGHLLHLRTPEIRRLAEVLLPGQWQAVARDARIRLLGADLRYPFQANLFGLPPELKARGLADYLAAITAPAKPASDFLSWARQNFGETMTRLFFEPYNRKLWTVPASRLTLDWMAGYVPKPDPGRVLAGAFSEIPAGGGYNANFLYPRAGGIGRLAQALASRVPQLSLNAEVMAVDPRQRTLRTRRETLAWDRLISTLPLPLLVSKLVNPPAKVAEAARQLVSNSVLVVNLGVRKPCLHPCHWLYFPEKEFVFYRVGFPSNYGKVAPAGCSSLYAEVALPAGTGWARRPQIAARVRKDLLVAGLLHPKDEVRVEHCQYLRHAYVIFDSQRQPARKIVMDYLDRCGIESIGRWGNWEYSAMEDALLAGMRIAERLTEEEKKPKKRVTPLKRA